jgi:hypothetical protein
MSQKRGCLFWLCVICFVIPLAVLAATIASPPVLLAGLVLTALVVFSPERLGARVRAWSLWKRFPLLRSRTTAGGFVVALLLYTVPVPAFLSYELVAASAGGQTGNSGPPVSSLSRSDPTAAPTAREVLTSTPVPAATATSAPTATPTLPPTTPPTAPPTALPATPGPTSPPPAVPPPPASACTASVKFPTPGDGGDETVFVSSNVPNAAVSIVAHYKTTDHSFATATDGSGNASDTFSIGRPTVGFTVRVDVSVGSASCGTSFTPQ